MRHHVCFGLVVLLDEVVASLSNSSIGIGIFLSSKLQSLVQHRTFSLPRLVVAIYFLAHTLQQ